MHIILGLIIIIVGSILVIKSEFFLRNFGKIDFFEKYLGSEGGSRLGYKIIGVIIVFIGVLILTNLINDFLFWILGPLIRLQQ